MPFAPLAAGINATVPLRRKTPVISLALVTLVVLAIGTLSTLDWDEYNGNAAIARHARAEAENAQRVLSALEDAEAARFGYLLTNDPNYLARVATARQVIETSLAALSRPDTGVQDAATAHRIRMLVDEKLTDFQRTLDLARSGSPAAARTEEGVDRSRQKMEEVRAELIGTIDSQYKLYAARSFQARRHAGRTRLIVLLGTGLLALLLLAANIHIHKLIQAQGRFIEELEAARDREERGKNAFETTLQAIGEAVISVDVDGRIQFMNSATERLTRWPSRSAVGAGLSEVVPLIDEASGRPLDNPAVRAMAEGVAVAPPQPTLLLTTDGERLPVEHSAAPLRNRQGETVGAVLVVRDVSPRREAQRQLEESERRYRLLFESNPHPMWVFEVGSLRFLEVNQSAVDHYGYSREEFLGMTLRDIRPEEDVPELLRDTERHTAARHTDGPWRHRKKDGTLIYVEITAHPFVFQGHDARFVLAHDITRRAQLEEQLRQSQKLEAVGRLAGGVAHDFNNMLTVISGYTDFLSGISLAHAASEAVREIAEAARRAASLTQQLLAFSRRQVLQPQVLNLNTSVASMQKMLVRLLGEDIEVRTVLAPDLWNVSADPGQIDQILMNLAVNSRDAMESGGTLTIETANATLDDDYVATHIGVEAGDYVRLTITDTGDGMDAATKARLFEPFFTTKDMGRGTGLGLSTVYGIVKQSHGNIWVYSEPGKGTTFALYLPRVSSPAAPAIPMAESPQAQPMGQTVLVVEDDPTVCKLVSTMLTSSGYTVLSAQSADEAFRLCANAEPIDLLLCDMVLPHADGPAIAQKVLTLRPGLPVLFMSGYTEHAALREEHIGRTTPFLQKPFTRQALTEKIQSLLNHHGTV
jgi:two-component system, cell cycle sensor histidine kinase and response regulator CckA